MKNHVSIDIFSPHLDPGVKKINKMLYLIHTQYSKYSEKPRFDRL